MAQKFILEIRKGMRVITGSNGVRENKGIEWGVEAIDDEGD
jgi:hypothetical protein